MIKMIVAMDKNGVIASSKHNGLLWHIPTDLKYFKAITSGSIVVMGRKTYESIGHPLPSRENMILTTDKHFQALNCTIVNSIDEILLSYQSLLNMFIIGGASLYKQMMPYAQRIYITRIDHSFDGDIFFPEINQNFVLINQRQEFADNYNLSFKVYKKVN